MQRGHATSWAQDERPPTVCPHNGHVRYTFKRNTFVSWVWAASAMLFPWHAHHLMVTVVAKSWKSKTERDDSTNHCQCLLHSLVFHFDLVLLPFFLLSCLLLCLLAVLLGALVARVLLKELTLSLAGHCIRRHAQATPPLQPACGCEMSIGRVDATK